MSDKYMKDFNGEKIFCLEYDKETLKDMVIDKQEEIERLNNIIDKAIEYIKEKARNNCWIDQYEACDLIKILKGEHYDSNWM